MFLISDETSSLQIASMDIVSLMFVPRLRHAVVWRTRGNKICWAFALCWLLHLTYFLSWKISKIFWLRSTKTLIVMPTDLSPQHLAQDISGTHFSPSAKVLVLFYNSWEGYSSFLFCHASRGGYFVLRLQREGKSGRKEEQRKHCSAFHVMGVIVSSLEKVQTVPDCPVSPLSTSILLHSYFLDSFSKTHLWSQDGKE